MDGMPINFNPTEGGFDIELPEGVEMTPEIEQFIIQVLAKMQNEQPVVGDLEHFQKKLNEQSKHSALDGLDAMGWAQQNAENPHMAELFGGVLETFMRPYGNQPPMAPSGSPRKKF